MPVDDLWYLAHEADQHGQQMYHELRERHDDPMEVTRTRYVSRRRFRTLAERTNETGAPYGAHTIVYRPDGSLLLVRHEGVDLWVLPGGGVDDAENYREAAERELAEEAGIEASYDGLAILTKLRLVSGEQSMCAVLPVYAAQAETTETEIADPDDEISKAGWFHHLPDDTRDREDLVAWRRQQFS
ncbi:NUDIX domain-containing protein [Haloarchaeobius sp. HME9146]|uniref:NUDIX domain-containing protein n=1 Tax=Haloarchaeobius sp. HME9146 TaxID=2978732 RepID=UPI0026E51772|nr:NUDIX domain-containing protein [Haloarchaeobius sp. HME9146]